MHLYNHKFTFMLDKPQYHYGIQFRLPKYGICNIWYDTTGSLHLGNQYWCWNPDAYLHIRIYWSKWWKYGVRFIFQDTIKQVQVRIHSEPVIV